jgi:CRISPR-associated endonuclease/helicase Cas3
MLDGSTDAANDVSDAALRDDAGNPRRVRVWDQFDPKARGMRLIRRIDFPVGQDEEEGEVKSWYWFERPAGGDSDGSKSAVQPVRWEDHTQDVIRNIERFTADLPLEPQLKRALVLAARFHDLGKKREHWQRSIGNPNPREWYAKSGGGWRPRNFSSYRHEFGSLMDIPELKEFTRLAEKPELQELILHLVAAHHGFARPHFPPEYAADSPEHSTAAAGEMARTVPQRFASLQRRYGRWGLAYLESLLRAADYDASAHPSRSERTQ